MADLARTTTLVLKGSGAQVGNGIAGATIEAGQNVYLDDTAQTVKLTDANVAAAQDFDGIALNDATAGQPINYISAGSAFAHGLTGVVAGDVLYASQTPGETTKTYADISSGSMVIITGVAISATLSKVQGLVAALKP